MRQPLLSIIIPVYNAQLTLKSCVDSIIAQEFTNYEIILINDGSVDNSRIICEEYAESDKRIIVINQENQGVSAARNAGLDIAKGYWITFIDSDDYINPHFFDNIESFEEDIVFLEFVSLWKGKLVKNVPIKEGISSFKVFVESYIDTPYIKGPCSKLIKKSKIGTLRFDKEMRIGEDTRFMYFLLTKLESYKVCYSDTYIVRCPDVELNQKYEIDVLYAIDSLQKIFHAFCYLVETLEIRRKLFFSTIQFFKYISHSDWKSNPSQWYGNKAIREMYRYVWPDLSLKQKMKLVGAFILRK